MKSESLKHIEETERLLAGQVAEAHRHGKLAFTTKKHLCFLVFQEIKKELQTFKKGINKVVFLRVVCDEPDRYRLQLLLTAIEPISLNTESERLWAWLDLNKREGKVSRITDTYHRIEHYLEPEHRKLTKKNFYASLFTLSFTEVGLYKGVH